VLSISKNPGLEFKKPNSRFWVPDLSPKDRKDLAQTQVRWVFVAESPHINEIEPDRMDQRRPLCGVAGRQWWGLLSELLEGEANSDVSLDRLIHFCKREKIAVMNAVQSPLDPKITKYFPEAEPVANLGFNKVSGPNSFKRLKNSAQVQNAIHSLRERLLHPQVAQASVHCLGNDAEWFVSQALGQESLVRLGEKIPHPSAWWRRGGQFGRTAREKLTEILDSHGS
jgi:hypothetical protein